MGCCGQSREKATAVKVQAAAPAVKAPAAPSAVVGVKNPFGPTQAGHGPAPLGTLLRKGKSLFVGSGGGTALELVEVQLEGKKRMGGEVFANGQRLQENETFGDLS